MKIIAWVFWGWLLLLTTAQAETKAGNCLVHAWKGTVGKVPVMMEFDESPSTRSLDGKYYYRTSLVDLILKKDVENRWQEFDSKNDLTGLLTLNCSGNILSGEWKSTDGKTTLPIQAEIAKSYSAPRLSAVKPSVVKHGDIHAHQYEILAVLSVNNANTIVEGLRLSGNSSGIQKINNMLLNNFLSEIDTAISCNTRGRFDSGNTEYESDSKVIAWNNDFVVINSSNGGYCGDAPHPFSGGGVETYSLSSGDREDISLWLSEAYRQRVILTSELGQVLSERYRRQRGDDANECLKVTSFSGSVWPTDEGLTFQSAAPYAVSGCAENISVPYNVISPYLSPLGQSQAKAFQK